MGNLVGQWGIMRFNVPGNQKSQAFLTVKMIGFVGNPFGRALAIITGYFPVLDHRELNWCRLNWVNPEETRHEEPIEGGEESRSEQHQNAIH